MKVLRTIIVDDERPARDQLAKMLRVQPGIELAGEARNLAEAIELAVRAAPDVVFLDISMPPDSGFDLLPHLHPGTRVVFVTAHEEHAIRAFEQNAADYLLKPIRPERLAKTLERLRGAGTAAATPENAPRVDLGKGRTIPLCEITAVAADGNYSRVYLLGGGNLHVRRPMHEWVAELEDRGFIRPGRSLLLLASAIHHLESRTRNESYLYLTGGAEPLKLGRSISARVRQLMGR